MSWVVAVPKIPPSQSQEKIDLLRMLGADVRPVPAVAFENPLNYNHQAREYAESIPNAIWTDQFDNTANAEAHFKTTGPEIWQQTNGEVDGFICATGTGGTLAGVGRYLHEKSQGKTQIWLADPPGSVLHSYISSGGKLKERSGGSITEGLSSSFSSLRALAHGLEIQVLARGVSQTTWAPSWTKSPAPSILRTRSPLP